MSSSPTNSTRHAAIFAVSRSGQMIVDGTKCESWPLWGRYGLVLPNGVSVASSDHIGPLLACIKANDS